MADDKNLIDRNPCGKCRANNLSFCKCAGAGSGDGDNKDAQNDRKNDYKTQINPSVAAQENKLGLVELNKPTFAFEVKPKAIDQQEKITLQPVFFSKKPVPLPSVKRNDNKQQKEDKTDNTGVSTESKLFHPTPFSMTMELKII